MPETPFDLLVVEDDDQFREMASEWMKRKGHRVQSAANAQEALKHVGQQRFDVVLADMNMPGISGLELLQRLKADGVESEVIILTGQATIQAAVEAMKLGACDYLTKPFPLSELEHRCAQAAERGRLVRGESESQDDSRSASPRDSHHWRIASDEGAVSAD
jgi:DNA-binding NtrC family response regulator